MRQPPWFVSSLLSVALLGAVADAQSPLWTKADVFEPRSGACAVYDAGRAVLVLFGGFQSARYDETWEWDGVAWTVRALTTRPSPRRDAAIAYDSLRGRVVLFGGNGTAGGLADTWEYDGLAWSQRTPTTSPAARDGAQMAFDSTRGVTILYGGQGTTAFGDTWHWNGTTWTQLAPASSPGPRELGGLVDDPARQRLVLFGGTTGTANQNDTWEWNGSTWAAVPTANAPAVRQRFGLAHDSARGRTVLFGGSAGTTRFNDVWEYDGANWTAITTASAPVVRDRVAFAYDAVRARCVLCSGRGPTNTVNQADTWDWDGSAWTLRSAPQLPTARSEHALAGDPLAGHALLFGGLGASGTLTDTWRFDGGEWRQLAPTHTPGARRGHAMVLDRVRGRVVLFGGVDASGTGLDDTWEWDGSDWLLQNPANRPAPRSGHALAFDATRGRVVLFGGLFGLATAALNDTWEWDGSTWFPASPTTAPSARTDHAMAFDAISGAVLLFGGSTAPATTPFGDTWRWDGTDWTALAPANAPPARSKAALAHDPVRVRTLLFGGRDAVAVRNDSWEWDGTNWTASSASGPSARADAELVHDAMRRRHVLFGGALASGNSAETWEYAFADGADVVPFGSGCAGSVGVPVLTATNGPSLGNAAFTLQLTAVVPNTVTLFGIATGRVLVPLGACTVLIDGSAHLLAEVADGSGTANHVLPVPNSLALLGAHVFAQGAGLDGAGPLFGFLALSNGLDVQVGR